MSQKQALLNLLLDGAPHRTDEIVTKVYGPGMSLSRVGARIWDLKQDGYVFEPGRHDEVNPKLYWYKLKTAKTYEKREINPTVKENPRPEVQPVHQTERQGSLFHLRSTETH